MFKKKQHADLLPFHKKLLPEHMTKAGDQASSDGQKKKIRSCSARFQMNDKTTVVSLFDNCIFSYHFECFSKSNIELLQPISMTT
jgi:hypothetical protein